MGLKLALNVEVRGVLSANLGMRTLKSGWRMGERNNPPSESKATVSEGVPMTTAMKSHNSSVWKVTPPVNTAVRLATSRLETASRAERIITSASEA